MKPTVEVRIRHQASDAHATFLTHAPVDTIDYLIEVIDRWGINDETGTRCRVSPSKGEFKFDASINQYAITAGKPAVYFEILLQDAA